MSSTKTPSTRKAADAVDIQADEPRRLTHKGKPSWEVLVERLEYNMPAWNASNWIVKHNLKIIRHVQHIQDYETGKRSDPPPFSFAELLNPRLNAREPSVKRNTGLDRLDYLFASLKRYEPGHAPAQNYENVFITTRAHQCWQQHRDEWDAHVRSCGEEKGFAGYKPLARAYGNR